MPGGFVCSGRMRAKMRSGKVKEAVAGERTVRSLFNKQQRSFFADCVPGISIDDLTILGPIMVMKGEVLTERLRRSARRRALALPRRLPHLGAVDQGLRRQKRSRWRHGPGSSSSSVAST